MSQRDAPKLFPASLKTSHISDAELLSLIEKEKEGTASLEKVRAEIRAISGERDAALRALDNTRDFSSKGNDEFQQLVDRRQEIRSRMDELQLVQSKISDSRNELQLIGFEIKPIENELNDLKGKIEEAIRNEAALKAQQADLLKECGGFESATDADASILKIEEQLESAKKSGQTQALNTLTRQKNAAEKAKKNVMASYALDDRILKEGRRKVALEKTLDSKEGQLKSLNAHRTSLREKLDSQKSIDDDYRKLKAEVVEINKKLDAIQAKKKERTAVESESPASTAKANVTKLQTQQKELFRQRDTLIAELAELSKTVQSKFMREVKFNPQYRRHLIGRGGATMETLMQDFSVGLFLDGQGRDAAVIYGPPEATEACAAAIEQIISSAEASDQTDTITFNPSLTKFIIGAKGATIDKLQTTSGARIKVEGDKITMSGTQEAIDAAKALLNEVFANNASEELSFDPAASDIVIGRGGATIRQIERESGVNSIRADKDRGVLIISGHQDNVTKAKAMYEEILHQTRNKVSFTIPAKMASLVIGPQGKVIREIQEETGAVVNIQNKGNDSAVTIRGSPDAVREARRRVEDIALRDEIKIPFDSSMAAYLTTRPIEEGEGGEKIEKLSPVEAIRLQCECDQVVPLRAEGKIVIRGRPESVTKAKALLLKFLQTNAPKTLRIPIPVVLIPHITRRQENGSILDKFRNDHAANISNVDLDRTTKMATVIGQPNASIGAVNTAAAEFENIVRSFKITIVPVPSYRCGAVVGAGGKVISDIQATTNTVINVDRDAGEVTIFSPSGNEDEVEKAAGMVSSIRDAPRDVRQ